MRQALKKANAGRMWLRHMNNPWNRLRPLPAAPLVVRRRYFIEVPSLLPAAQLVVRRIILWSLYCFALWLLNRGAQVDARPAVRAHAPAVKKDSVRKVSPARAKYPATIADNANALG
jgi:hypothetical protein